jgi:hypothetical protein
MVATKTRRRMKLIIFQSLKTPFTQEQYSDDEMMVLV